jgi:cytochrome oxidase assembly protein ShyY1
VGCVRRTLRLFIGVSKTSWLLPERSTDLNDVRRWGGWLALVIVFAIATSALAWWQFDRRDQKVAAIDLVIANYDAPAIPLGDLEWRVTAEGVALDEWRQVIVTGQYLPELTTLARNRPLNGQPGFLQLVPFQLSTGEVLIVERGWLPTGSRQDSPDFMPTPDATPRELVLHLRPSERDFQREPVPGQIASIHLETLRDRFSLPVITDYYGRLVTEVPASAEFPFQMPRPSLNEGNHLSYALQWVLFGLMAFWAFFWAYRQDRQQQLVAAGLAQPKVRRRTQADVDAEAEDH